MLTYMDEYYWHRRVLCLQCSWNEQAESKAEADQDVCPRCGSAKSEWRVCTMRADKDRTDFHWWNPWTWRCPRIWEVRVRRTLNDGYVTGVMPLTPALLYFNAAGKSNASRAYDLWLRHATELPHNPKPKLTKPITETAERPGRSRLQRHEEEQHEQT